MSPYAVRQPPWFRGLRSFLAHRYLYLRLYFFFFRPFRIIGFDSSSRSYTSSAHVAVVEFAIFFPLVSSFVLGITARATGYVLSSSQDAGRQSKVSLNRPRGLLCSGAMCRRPI